MGLQQYKMSSSIGPLYLVASQKGLRGIFWNKQPSPVLKTLDPTQPQQALLQKTMEQVEAYLKGKLKKFQLPLDLVGTPFQKKVWHALLRIPYGSTLSYQEIAHEIKHPMAYRAVGTANGRNPASLIVPCHRAIQSSGFLGGYAGGLAIKQKLLRMEGAKFKTKVVNCS